MARADEDRTIAIAAFSGVLLNLVATTKVLDSPAKAKTKRA
jgi:hypothetical protein